MAVRKQVDELTTEDLDQFPIWEFALDEEGKEGQDEATVRPVNTLRPSDPLEGSRVVKAQFTYADGATAYGYLTPAADSTDLGAVQPVVITADDQVAFWCGIIEPSSEDIQLYYLHLSKPPSSVFPITFESTVPVLEGNIRGSIPGFMVLEDWRTGKFKVLA